ncbi:PSD1 and planctomycete cytochrome C domain-containing protein [Allorhodopirellula heiligendammensis]|uniref:Planctomycete cytochrome C n=1 Tax=Allorhodopirellula heiligendammensis TaxID=2714739 RepID=A0A5C6BZ06_9BACT|nr:PSD1 and planctomycete cytochrome C domain-containing protein [Allorhodopirellula heiligendammensis]TWU16144.1 Planctomycete cytochrome C [Allorhodopirellula heiligendammensis]
MLRFSAATFLFTMAWTSMFVRIAAAEPQVETATIDFSRQVQPILSDRCFPCHGPDVDNQDSAFRADTKENLFADLGGYAAVVPGNLEASELHARIHASDPDDQMPPADSNRVLTDADKRILDAWIEQGAPYAKHWAFTTPKRESPPTEVFQQQVNTPWAPETRSRWTEHPIDAFVAQRLMEANLSPSPPADPATLLRRAALTLTGMLPPQGLQERYLANPTDEAYAAAVDELLSSMAYAERQSLRWLDASRYADTDGYQNDAGRTNWPYRDWVTQAFYENMPFDQFTILQIAGDMLPDATDSQRLATAFNRNHRQNAEGGALAEEFFVENVIDRVETTATVWLGLTAGCARCHDHKFDPISQREFFSLYAYFNNIGERGIGPGTKANPTMQAYSPLANVPDDLLAKREAAENSIAAARRTLDQRMEAWRQSVAADINEESAEWTVGKIGAHEVLGQGRLDKNDDQSLLFTGSDSREVTYRVDLDAADQPVSAIMIEALPDDRFAKPRQLAPSVNGNFVLTDWKILLNEQPVELASIAASFEQPGYPITNAIDDDPKTGWAVHGGETKPSPVQAVVQLASPITVQASDEFTVQLYFGSNFAGHSIGKLQVKLSKSPGGGLPRTLGLDEKTWAAIRKPLEKQSNRDRKQIQSHYEKIDEPLRAAIAEKAAVEKEFIDRGFTRATVMVMDEQEGERTPAYLLERGAYDAPDESNPLPRGVPKVLLASDASPQPKDRLELAKWLVSPENPLTARVIVNRMWQDHFGTGLVKTTEDFGLQSEQPSHPELLDYLAFQFIESGWDMRAMHRMIMTSQTYRQSSHTNEKLNSIDPQNRLLARGPRYRGDGFMIRDVALQASGLLSKKLGGPSVKPYQPDGLWAVVAANVGTEYKIDAGEDLYRKSMYSYWKRAVNPPRQTIFDAGGREVCNVRVRRTNTPLQSLVLMNDPTFIEAARHLAENALQNPDTEGRDRLANMYQQALAHPANDNTLDVLEDNLSYFREYYASRPEQAASLISVGESPRDESLDASEHAALTATAHLIMNLDEFICIE